MPTESSTVSEQHETTNAPKPTQGFLSMLTKGLNALTPGTRPPRQGRILSVDALRGFDMFWITGGAFVFLTLNGVRRIGEHLEFRTDFGERQYTRDGVVHRVLARQMLSASILGTKESPLRRKS